MIKRILALLLVASSVQAASYNYNWTATGSWNTTTNWTPTGTPNGVGDQAHFDLETGGYTVAVDTNVTIAVLDMSPASGGIYACNITNAPGVTMTFDNGGSQGLIQMSSRSGQGKNLNVPLVFNEQVKFASLAYPDGCTLSGSITGTGQLLVDGLGGNLNVNISRSSWSGGTHITNAPTQIGIIGTMNAAAFGSGMIQFGTYGNSGTITLFNFTTRSGLATITNAVMFCRDMEFTSYVARNYNSAFAGPITLCGVIDFDIYTGGGDAGMNYVTLSGIAADGIAAGGITKTDTGRLNIKGINTFTGASALYGGELKLQTNSAMSSTAFLLSGTNTPSLYIEATNCINDSCVLTVNTGSGGINYPSIYFTAPASNETVAELWIDGTQQVAGTWGATGSGATNIDDDLFADADGVLTVSSGPTPPPTGTVGKHYFQVGGKFILIGGKATSSGTD